MPVQVAQPTTISALNTRSIIDHNEFMIGSQNFDNYYRLTDGSKIDTQISISCNDFLSIIDDFNNSIGVPEQLIALRLVHCLDTNNKYYLLLQLCRLNTIWENGEILVLYNKFKCYKIENGAFTHMPNINETYSVDTQYSYNVEFHEQGHDPNGDPIGQGEALHKDYNATYVRNVMFPWKNSIKELFNDNIYDEDTMLTFSAYTPNVSVPNVSNVSFPHGVVAYFSDLDGNGNLVPRINMTPYPEHKYKDKGTDYATLCPPNCHKYILPNG